MTTFEDVFELSNDDLIFTHEGIRCLVRMAFQTLNGYIELPDGHPWIGSEFMDHPAQVHGGVTLIEGNVHGFDTNHLGDRPHPDSPAVQQGLVGTLEEWDYVTGMPSRAWTQDMVIGETKNFSHQAAQAQK